MLIPSLHGREIEEVWWPDTESEKMRNLKASRDGCTLVAHADDNLVGFWIVQIIDGKDVAMFNPRYVEQIKWKEDSSA